LLDEVVLDAAGSGRCENLGPIEAVLANRYSRYPAGTATPSSGRGWRRWCSRRVHSLQMHGNEPAGTFREISDPLAYCSHSRHLELHLSQLRIEQFEQDFVGQAIANLGPLEPLVVQELLDAGLGGVLADLVVFVRGTLDDIHRRNTIL